MQQLKSFGTFLRSSIPYFLGMTIFCVVLIALLYAQTAYIIRTITVKGTSRSSPQIIGLDDFSGRSMITFSEKNEIQTLKKNNPYIKDVTIEKEFPTTLVITLSYETPTAYLKLKDGFYLLSESGKVLEKEKTKKRSHLPEISYYQAIPYQSYQSGDILVFEEVRDSLYFLKLLQKLHENIMSIDIESFHMLGLYTSDTKYFFSSEKDRSKQEYMLKESLKQLKITGKHYKTLDLRFDKPVVTF
jgi:hypothetical protein